MLALLYGPTLNGDSQAWKMQGSSRHKTSNILSQFLCSATVTRNDPW